MTVKDLEKLSETELRDLEAALRKVRKNKKAAKGDVKADLLGDPEVAAAKIEYDKLNGCYMEFKDNPTFPDAALSFRIKLRLQPTHNQLHGAWQDTTDGDPVDGDALFYFEAAVEPMTAGTVSDELLSRIRAAVEHTLIDAPFYEVYSLVESNAALDDYIEKVTSCLDRLNFLCPKDVPLLRLLSVKMTKEKK
jgi:hypothetical protein